MVKAIGVMEFGGPEALSVLDLPMPVPGSGEVRLRVHAAAVNPTDATFRSGGGQARLLGDRPPPYVPGMDAAGVVDELGPNTSTRLAVGDRVVALVLPAGPHGGAYAQYIVVPEASVVQAPRGVDLAAASTLLLNAVAARLALDALRLTPGQTVAVTGAAGALGGYAIQLAKAARLEVIADAAATDERLVTSLGADRLVPRGPDVALHVRALRQDGVDGLIDGAAQDGQVLRAIADGGALATVRGWAGPSERSITIFPIVSNSAANDTDLLRQLVDQVDDGTLGLRVASVLAADNAVQAHRQLAKGGLRGRLVLDFSP